MAATTTEDEATSAEVVLLQSKLHSMTEQIEKLNADIQYIKSFFVAKDQKKERRRLRKEQKQLEQERKAQAYAKRSCYEDLLRDLHRHPWQIRPTPPSGLSVKEEELVSLMSQGASDEEICKKMNLVACSINARLCVIRKTLAVDNREAIISFYLNYLEACREYRHRRCLYILSWLLNPPPGKIYLRTKSVKWDAHLGTARAFRLVGPRVPMRFFKDLRRYEQAALRMRLEGIADAEISQRVNVKVSSLKGYFAGLRSSLRHYTGVAVHSDDVLLEFYRRYLEIVDRREAAKALAASGKHKSSARNARTNNMPSNQAMYKRPAQNYQSSTNCYPFWKN